jgi:hypothetical protein
MRLTADVKIFGGGLFVFPGAVALHDEASLPAESVSISAARSGEKKLLVATSFGGVLIGADAPVGTAFFGVGAVWIVWIGLDGAVLFAPPDFLEALEAFILCWLLS